MLLRADCCVDLVLVHSPSQGKGPFILVPLLHFMFSFPGTLCHLFLCARLQSLVVCSKGLSRLQSLLPSLLQLIGMDFFWKSLPTNYSRLGKSDWSLLKPLLQTTKLCTWPAKRDDTRCLGRKMQSTTMGLVWLTLFLDIGNKQAPSPCNNQLTEAPILYVGCITNNQGHGKGQNWQQKNSTLRRNRFCVSKIVM